jgi:phage terminase large subunit-like protein
MPTDPDVPVCVINASRDKHVRAEPVSALYEKDKVKQAEFPDLKDQRLVRSTSYSVIAPI